MGRKAKLKQIRHQSVTSNQSDNHNNNDPNNFVKELAQQGYQLQRVNPCPDIPEKKTDPQV